MKTFKLSNDPRFEEKLVDVVGLYMNPPEKAIVLCADEKSSVQALDRTQASLPMVKGRGSGGRRGSHPPAPTEPYVNLSIHTALVTLITRRPGRRLSIPSGRRTAGTVS